MTCQLLGVEAIFSYSSTSVLHTAAVGLALVVVGIVFFKNKLPSGGHAYLSGRTAGLGVLAIFSGLLVLGMRVPDMYFIDHVVLNQEGFCSSNGLWFLPAVHDRFRYSDIDYVLRKRDHKGHYGLEVHFKNGEKKSINRTELWAENEIQISKVLQNHGVVLRE